jgi:hypothetical protein
MDHSPQRSLGLLTTLAGMRGARARTEQTVQFEVDAVASAMNTIRRLEGTGELTIHFANGKPNGLARWKTATPRS